MFSPPPDDESGDRKRSDEQAYQESDDFPRQVEKLSGMQAVAHFPKLQAGTLIFIFMALQQFSRLRVEIKIRLVIKTQGIRIRACFNRILLSVIPDKIHLVIGFQGQGFEKSNINGVF